ncbi:MAG TPA: DNA topoisomerase IB [Kofleriaceae bacterium]|nr:DNA topoisomerase IB [Kofleriaceae bacterium]
MTRKLRSALDPRAAALSASLRYSAADEPGIARKRRGRGFAYVGHDGRSIADPKVLGRIRSLVIPPAWRDVWICADADGHLQAVGRDARGRKQYRYHPRWRGVRDAGKYFRLAEFCRALPRLRKQVEIDLSCNCLCKEKVVALVVSLLERTQLRVGNDEYARTNDSYGATTLRDRHARVRGGAVELRFKGKGGKPFRVALNDRRMATMVRRCRELPGQRLFQYLDDSGRPAPVTSTDVNDYVREVTGGPFTAKDFRTWAATMACATLLASQRAGTSQAARKREVKLIVEAVAEQLGNTPTVCRNSYIHPAVIEGYMEDRLPPGLARKVRGLRRTLGDGAAKKGAAVGPPPTGSSFLAQVERAVLSYLEQAAERRAA